MKLPTHSDPLPIYYLKFLQNFERLRTLPLFLTKKCRIFAFNSSNFAIANPNIANYI